MNQMTESQPIVTGTSWEFFLYINNQTSKTLEIVNNGSMKKPDWGVWYLGSKDKQKPISVKSGESIQALGIRAAHGTVTGYEFRCSWCIKENDMSISNIDIKVDVPYTGKNSSSLTISGPIKVEGWDGSLPKKGHNFTRSITISEIDQLKNMPDMLFDETEKQYYDSCMNNNEMVQDWENLKNSLKELEQFNPIDVLPKEYKYPPQEIFIGRSKAHTIDKKYWNQLYDLTYEFEWQKINKVDEYFSVVIYSVNTNPRNIISLPAGMETVTESTVEVTSSITNTLTSTKSVGTVLKAEYSGLSAELSAEYSISNVLEDSKSKVERETKIITIGASEKNRLFVPWVFSKTVAIYRKNKKGKIQLIGISEWAEEILNKIYEY